jgi:hypothetical protein
MTYPAADTVRHLASGGWRRELSEALDALRAEGWTWQRIADECGLPSRQHAEQLSRRNKVER